MRKRAGIFLCITIATGIAVSIAQEKSADAQTSAGAALNGGMLMVAELSRGLGTKHAKAGDIIKARVAQDVIADGRIVVPRDSTMLGRVIKVKTSNKEDRESRLEVVFDHVKLKHGAEADFHGVIQAVAAPVPRHDQPDQMLPPGFADGGRSTGSTQPIGGTASRSHSGMGTVTVGPGTGTLGPANAPLPAPPAPPISATGALSAGARGVIGIADLALGADASSGTVKTVLRCRRRDIKLDGGTQIVVRVIPDVQHRTGNPATP
jgi:hypothetical protein